MAPWHNWIAQLPSKESVTGSNPVGVTNAPIAQLEEQGPSKAKVGGSSPSRCSTSLFAKQNKHGLVAQLDSAALS